jgi:hypothetical protein
VCHASAAFASGMAEAVMTAASKNALAKVGIRTFIIFPLQKVFYVAYF